MSASLHRSSHAVAACLDEIASIVESIDDVTFGTRRPDGVSGSIGAHVRHTLDHVAALVQPLTADIVDYDSRRRGTDVERHRRLAASELRRLANEVESLTAEDEARAIELSAVVEHSGQRVTARTTVGRELVFVLSHTVHHQAIIALLLADAGWRAPDRFGLAPSTPSAAPCAQSA